MESIERVKTYFMEQPGIQALLLGGSIAHGYESFDSDVDVMIIVTPDEHAARMANGTLQFFSSELVTYPQGYVDGKYSSIEFLRAVAERGSEPARFAFAGAQVLFSHIDQLDDVLRQIAAYPIDLKIDRIQRFYAQFETWAWYTGEALRLKNQYLLNLSTAKLILFGCRLILAHNERLYPYHKWLMRMVNDAPEKPAGLMTAIEQLQSAPSELTLRAFVECIRDYRKWETVATGWPNQFMLDSELTWMTGHTPIDDL
jgi:hypothetical protein